MSNGHCPFTFLQRRFWNALILIWWKSQVSQLPFWRSYFYCNSRLVIYYQRIKKAAMSIAVLFTDSLKVISLNITPFLIIFSEQAINQSLIIKLNKMISRRLNLNRSLRVLWIIEYIVHLNAHRLITAPLSAQTISHRLLIIEPPSPIIESISEQCGFR